MYKICNLGSFIRRKSDELHHKPGVGVIYSDGTVEREEFDTSIDVFQEELAERPEGALDLQRFLRELEEIGERGLNFRETVENYLRKEDLSLETKKIILEVLEPA